MFNEKCVVFLILASIFGSALSVCIDKNALYAVNASVHATKRSRAFKATTNFYLLENYTTIDVFQANVSVLCEGMIKNFPRLEVLSLINVNLSKIQPNAFQNVPRLTELSLAVNYLTTILKGSFDNLPSVETIYLSGNQISYIQEHTFADMPHLKAVHLDRNKLVEINGELFNGSPLITLIDFRFNLIEKITKNAFDDLKSSNSPILKILLNNNQISDVDAAAFESLTTVELHLDKNRLNAVSDLFHSLEEGSKLYLNHNQFNCVPEDVIENVKLSSKDLYMLDNPLACDCIHRIDDFFSNGVYGRGRFFYNSTFPCSFANQFVTFD